MMGNVPRKLPPFSAKGVCQNRRFLQGEEQSTRVGYNHYYKKTAEVIRTWVNENGWRQAVQATKLYGVPIAKAKTGQEENSIQTVTCGQKLCVQNLFVAIIT